jgi:hypothetical protein
LTEGFLTNVKSGMPKDEKAEQSVGEQAYSANESQPSTSMNSSIDSPYYVAPDGKRLKKDKKKKESSRPTMKELWSAYKDSSSTLYVAQYKHAGAEQREAEHVRPSLDHYPSGPTSPSILSPRQSVDRTFSMTSTSGRSTRHADMDKKKKKSGFMKNMFSGNNTWYGLVP